MDIRNIDIKLHFTNIRASGNAVKKVAENPMPAEGGKGQGVEIKAAEGAARVPQQESYRATFAVDEDSNVVIRIVDSEGNLVKQFPPEEYLAMAEQLKENVKNLFSTEV